MTRDEAVKIWDSAVTGKSCSPVDQLIALGVLKVDASKSVEEKVVEALSERLRIGAVSAGSIQKSLRDAGLKIVEA